jgi:predicted transcriptional regulator
MKRFLLRGFRRPRAALESALGRLERAVLEALWARAGGTTVRGLRDALGGRLAYTTLMTTLDRLYKKGLLERWRVGRAFQYRPCVGPEQLRQEMAADVFDSLLGQGAAAARPVMSTFLEAVEVRDAALLDELEALIREKRRRRGPT